MDGVRLTIRIGLIVIIGTLIGLEIASIGNTSFAFSMPYFGEVISLLILLMLFSFNYRPDERDSRAGAPFLTLLVMSFIFGGLFYMLAFFIALVAAGPSGIALVNTYAVVFIGIGAASSYWMLRRKQSPK